MLFSMQLGVCRKQKREKKGEKISDYTVCGSNQYETSKHECIMNSPRRLHCHHLSLYRDKTRADILPQTQNTVTKLLWRHWKLCFVRNRENVSVCRGYWCLLKTLSGKITWQICLPRTCLSAALEQVSTDRRNKLQHIYCHSFKEILV